MIWSKTSLKTLYPGQVQIAPLSGRIYQKARSTTSSRSYVLLYTSFAQIKKIAFLNTFAILFIYYAKHQIDQIDFSILWYFMAWLIYVNYQIGQADFSTFWHFHNLFTCYASYWIGQTYSSTF